MEIRFQPWDPSRPARTFHLGPRALRAGAIALGLAAVAAVVGFAGLPAVLRDLGRAAERLALHETAQRGSEAFASVRLAQARLARRLAADELFLARIAVACRVSLPPGWVPGARQEEGLAPETLSALLSQRVWQFEALRRTVAAQSASLPGRRIPSVSPVAPSAAIPVETFGPRISPLTRRDEFFPGLSLAVPEGARVIAAADGTAVFAGHAPLSCGAPWRALGTTVVVQHDDATWTVYGNLQRATVRRGARVSRGDQLGVAGRGALDPSPRVHYEVRRLERGGVRPLDPRFFVLDADWVSSADFAANAVPPEDDTLPRELR